MISLGRRKAKWCLNEPINGPQWPLTILFYFEDTYCRKCLYCSLILREYIQNLLVVVQSSSFLIRSCFGTVTTKNTKMLSGSLVLIIISCLLTTCTRTALQAPIIPHANRSIHSISFQTQITRYQLCRTSRVECQLHPKSESESESYCAFPPCNESNNDNSKYRTLEQHLP